MANFLKNAVRVLPLIERVDDYIALYTEFDGFFNIGDRLYIMVYNQSTTNSYNYLDSDATKERMTDSDGEVFINKMGVVVIDKINNKLILDIKYESLLGLNGTLKFNMSSDIIYISRVYIKDGTINNGSVNALMCRNITLNPSNSLAITWYQGIIPNTNDVITNINFTKKYTSSSYIRKTEYDTLTKQVSSYYTKNNYDRGISFIGYGKSINSVKINLIDCTISDGNFNYCNFKTQNIPHITFNGGKIENSTIADKCIINNGYFINTSIMNQYSIWNNGRYSNNNSSKFLLPTWYNGTWESGEFPSTCVWMNGRFLNGNFNSSTWIDGVFYNGTITGSIWYNGQFNGGVFCDKSIWHNGVFNGGKMDDIVVVLGKFNNGTIANSIITEMNFYDGNINKSEINSCNIYGGTITSSKINSSNIYGGVITGTSTEKSNITNSVINQSNINFSRIDKSTINNGRLSGINVINSIINYCVASNKTNITYSVWNDGIANDIRLDHVDWYDGIANYAVITNSHWYNGSFNNGIFGNPSESEITKTFWHDGEFHFGIFNGVWTKGTFHFGTIFNKNSKLDIFYIPGNQSINIADVTDRFITYKIFTTPACNESANIIAPQYIVGKMYEPFTTTGVVMATSTALKIPKLKK